VRKREEKDGRYGPCFKQSPSNLLMFNQRLNHKLLLTFQNTKLSLMKNMFVLA